MTTHNAALLRWAGAYVPQRGVVAWLAAQADTSPHRAVIDCPRGSWLLWLASQVDYPAHDLESVVRPAVLRAARVYAADACERAGLFGHATILRTLPGGAPWLDIKRAAYAAEGAAEHAACPVPFELLAMAVVAGVRGETELQRAARWATETAKAAAGAAAAAGDAHWSGAATLAADAALAKAALVAPGPERATTKRAAAAVEHARCADDVRSALPDLAERWAAALACDAAPCTDTARCGEGIAP